MLHVEPSHPPQPCLIAQLGSVGHSMDLDAAAAPQLTPAVATAPGADLEAPVHLEQQATNVEAGSSRAAEGGGQEQPSEAGGTTLVQAGEQPAEALVIELPGTAPAGERSPGVQESPAQASPQAAGADHQPSVSPSVSEGEGGSSSDESDGEGGDEGDNEQGDGGSPSAAGDQQGALGRGKRVSKGSTGQGPSKRRKNVFKPVRSSQRCGVCRTCLNPQLKKACETVRKQQAVKQRQQSADPGSGSSTPSRSASPPAQQAIAAAGKASNQSIPEQSASAASASGATAAENDFLHIELKQILNKDGKVSDPKHVPRFENLLEVETRLGARFALMLIVETSGTECKQELVKGKTIKILESWITEGQEKVKDQAAKENMMLRIIRCLASLPVDLETLKKTKIGRTVGNMRKNTSGELMKAAKALVDQWKALVDETAAPGEKRPASSRPEESQPKKARREGELRVDLPKPHSLDASNKASPRPLSPKLSTGATLQAVDGDDMLQEAGMPAGSGVRAAIQQPRKHGLKPMSSLEAQAASKLAQQHQGQQEQGQAGKAGTSEGLKPDVASAGEAGGSDQGQGETPPTSPGATATDGTATATGGTASTTPAGPVTAPEPTTTRTGFRLGSIGSGSGMTRLGSLRDTTTLPGSSNVTRLGSNAMLSALQRSATMFAQQPPSVAQSAAARAAAARARAPSPEPSTEPKKEKKKSVAWVGEENLVSVRWFRKEDPPQAVKEDALITEEEPAAPGAPSTSTAAGGPGAVADAAGAAGSAYSGAAAGPAGAGGSGPHAPRYQPQHHPGFETAARREHASERMALAAHHQEEEHERQLLMDRLSVLSAAIEWFPPPLVPLNSAWSVGHGEESREVHIIAERCQRLPAACYPTPSHVPPSPAEPAHREPDYDPSQVPIIPLNIPHHVAAAAGAVQAVAGPPGHQPPPQLLHPPGPAGLQPPPPPGPSPASQQPLHPLLPPTALPPAGPSQGVQSSAYPAPLGGQPPQAPQQAQPQVAATDLGSLIAQLTSIAPALGLLPPTGATSQPQPAAGPGPAAPAPGPQQGPPGHHLPPPGPSGPGPEPYRGPPMGHPGMQEPPPPHMYPMHPGGPGPGPGPGRGPPPPPTMRGGPPPSDHWGPPGGPGPGPGPAEYEREWMGGPPGPGHGPPGHAMGPPNPHGRGPQSYGEAPGGPGGYLGPPGRSSVMRPRRIDDLPPPPGHHHRGAEMGGGGPHGQQGMMPPPHHQQQGGPPGPPSSKVCLFFNTPQGCRHGDNCRFVHVRDDHMDVNAAIANISRGGGPGPGGPGGPPGGRRSGWDEPPQGDRRERDDRAGNGREGRSGWDVRPPQGGGAPPMPRRR